MRIVTLLLLLGGLLLWPVGPAAASPNGPAGGDRAGQRGCGAKDDEEATYCPRRLQLSGRIRGSDLLLEWEGRAGAEFEVYYSSAPFSGYLQIDESPTNSYRETLAHLDMVEINDYYEVREKESGQVSNRLGVFTFALHGAHPGD